MKLPEFFGLDIGTHSLKLAQVKYLGADTAQLLKLARADIVGGLLNTPDVNNLAKEIKNLKDAAGIATKKVVIALPESSIFSRLILLPEVDESKLEQAIYYEAKQYLPVTIDDVQLEWIQVSRSERDGKAFVQYLLVAAPKKIVSKYLEVMELAGLEVIAVETETIATARSYTYNNNFTEGILVMDFGGTNTDISVVMGKNVIFSQSIGTGSDVLTKALVSEFNLDILQAEQYKRTYGLLRDQAEGKIAGALEPMMKIITNEINKTINYFKEHLRENTPKQIFVVGDGANLPGLADYLTQTMGIPSRVVDPIMSLKVDNKLQTEISQINTAGFSVAVGLALKTE
jgi:type IV pilus assembly protein PilM